MAQRSDIFIDQGSDFSTTIPVTDDDGNPVDVQGLGYTANAHFKKTYSSSNTFNFDVSLSTTNIIISLSGNTSANIAAGRFVYDIKLWDSSNNPLRVAEGIVHLTPQVTT